MLRLAILLAPLVAAYPQHHALPSRSEPGTSKWTPHDLIGHGPRQEHAVVGLEDQIYILGGVATNDQGEIDTINRMEYYRISDESWHVAAPLPQPLNHLNVAAVEDKLYLLGALSGGANWTAHGESYIYHTRNDSWTLAAPLPKGTARGSSAVGVLDDTIYLAGGMTYLAVADEGKQDSVATVSSYNITAAEWNTNFPALPQPRQHVGGAVVGGTFYVLGGREDGISGLANTVYALDLGNPTAWRTLSSMPTARGGLACAAIECEVFCFGGEGSVNNEKGIFDQVEAYDTRNDEWRSLADMPAPRHGTGAASVGGRIYIPGGGLTEAGHPTLVDPVGLTGWFDSFGLEV